MIQFVRFPSALALAAVALSAEAAEASTEKFRIAPEARAAVIGGFPKFVPKPVQPARAAQPLISRREPVDPDVLSLPTMVVKRKMPTTDDMITLKGKTEQHMNTYLGSKTGFDRGFLNKRPLSFGAGFARVTLLGAVSNEDRALEARFDDQRLKHREELLATIHALAEAEDAEKAAWLRRESNGLHNRQPDIRRR